MRKATECENLLFELENIFKYIKFYTAYKLYSLCVITTKKIIFPVLQQQQKILRWRESAVKQQEHSENVE